MDAILQYFADFNLIKVIDMAGLVIGLVYLWLEFKASIWLWLVSIIMPIVHGYLYFARGLYADFGMQVYYILAAIYGYAMWRWAKRSTNVETQNFDSSEKEELPITHFPLRRVLPVTIIGLALWALLYWILITFTDSSVPVYDSFTTALSMVALWALAQKYAEQWLMWLVVDAVCASLYIYKQIPFSATLYAIYTVIAIFGYVYWLKKIPQSSQTT